MTRRPPAGAPLGTLWFGGPVDRFKITLRIRADELDPEEVSGVLGCMPTTVVRKGAEIAAGTGSRFAKTGQWSLCVKSEDLDPDSTFEDALPSFLDRLPSNPELWASLTNKYKVDIFCGLFLAAANRGFGISAKLSRMLAERNLEIGFDLYFDPPPV